MRVSAIVTGIPEAVAEVDSAVHKTARVLVQEIWDNLMDDTPVASGRARANWQISSTSSGAAELSPGDYPRPVTPPIPRFNVLYILNPLDYVQYLNDGWSDQAPALFIERAVDDAEDKIRATKRLR